MKKIKIIITIINFLISFPIHFVYGKYPSYITSIFFPINESLWEHMKIITTSILISSLIESIIYKINKIKTSNFIFSIPIISIIVVIFYLTIYLIISKFIPHNFIITIILMFITYIICQIISFKIINKDSKNYNLIGIILLITICMIYTHFTYYPPKYSIFYEEKQKRK